MIPMAILSRYARSLADVAAESGEEQGVGQDLKLYLEIFHAVPDLLTAFDSPAVPREVKDRMLGELLSRYRIRNISENFLKLLLEHNRIRHFEQVCQSYLKTIDERKGIVTAKVSAAAPLSERELASLRESLMFATGKTVNLELKTDPNLLGGLVVQVESTVYDGSIRNQLSEMRRHLAED
jgi:F-type H+-transporting ATPase subunit delta